MRFWCKIFTGAGVCIVTNMNVVAEKSVVQ